MQVTYRNTALRISIDDDIDASIANVYRGKLYTGKTEDTMFIKSLS